MHGSRRYLIKHRVKLRNTVATSIVCKDNHGAPLLELSSFKLSKCVQYMKFVVDVNLASILLHKSR
jgi:hypothetical protein